MKQEYAIQLFENNKVRTVWDSNQEKCFLSIIDVIETLTESVDLSAYWSKLKQRLKHEGNQTVTYCQGLKMIAPDDKMQLTDGADT